MDTNPNPLLFACSVGGKANKRPLNKNPTTESTNISFPEKFMNGILNKNLSNIKEDANLDFLNVKEASVENKENDMLTSNYRLLYHLYVEHKEKHNSADMWPLITHNYNFLSNSKHTVDEMKKIWTRMPSMIKRKFMLDSFTMKPDDNDETNKKIKRSYSKKKTTKQDVENPQIASILKNTSASNQNEPYDFSTNNSKQLKVSFNLSNVENSSNKIDKGTQTEIDLNESDDLSRKESLLKISILEVRLKFLQMQYKKQFE